MQSNPLNFKSDSIGALVVSELLPSLVFISLPQVPEYGEVLDFACLSAALWDHSSQQGLSFPKIFQYLNSLHGTGQDRSDVFFSVIPPNSSLFPDDLYTESCLLALQQSMTIPQGQSPDSFRIRIKTSTLWDDCIVNSAKPLLIPILLKARQVTMGFGDSAGLNVPDGPASTMHCVYRSTFVPPMESPTLNPRYYAHGKFAELPLLFQCLQLPLIGNMMIERSPGVFASTSGKQRMLNLREMLPQEYYSPHNETIADSGEEEGHPLFDNTGDFIGGELDDDEIPFDSIAGDHRIYSPWANLTLLPKEAVEALAANVEKGTPPANSVSLAVSSSVHIILVAAPTPGSGVRTGFRPFFFDFPELGDAVEGAKPRLWLAGVPLDVNWVDPTGAVLSAYTPSMDKLCSEHDIVRGECGFKQLQLSLFPDIFHYIDPSESAMPAHAADTPITTEPDFTIVASQFSRRLQPYVFIDSHFLTPVFYRQPTSDILLSNTSIAHILLSENQFPPTLSTPPSIMPQAVIPMLSCPPHCVGDWSRQLALDTKEWALALTGSGTDLKDLEYPPLLHRLGFVDDALEYATETFIPFLLHESLGQNYSIAESGEGGIFVSLKCMGNFTDPISGYCTNASHPLSHFCAWGTGTHCRYCPRGALCPGGWRLWPRPGFWVASEKSSAVIECAPPDAEVRCPGWYEGMDLSKVVFPMRNNVPSIEYGFPCGAGYKPTSPGCFSCERGFFRANDGRCEACPVHTNSFAKFRPFLYFLSGLFGLYLSIFILVYIVQRKEIRSIKDSANRTVAFAVWAWTALQIIIQLSKGVQPGMPAWLLRFYSVLSMLQFEGISEHPDCNPNSFPFLSQMIQFSIVSTFLLLFLFLEKINTYLFKRLHVSNDSIRSVGGFYDISTSLNALVALDWKAVHLRNQLLQRMKQHLEAPVTRSVIGGVRYYSFPIPSRAKMRALERYTGLFTRLSLKVLTLLYPLVSSSVVDALTCDTMPMTVRSYLTISKNGSMLSRTFGFSQQLITALQRGYSNTIDYSSLVTHYEMPLEVSVLRSNPNYVCWESPHSTLAIYSILVLITYLVGYPWSSYVLAAKSVKSTIKMNMERQKSSLDATALRHSRRMSRHIRTSQNGKLLDHGTDADTMAYLAWEDVPNANHWPVLFLGTMFTRMKRCCKRIKLRTKYLFFPRSHESDWGSWRAKKALEAGAPEDVATQVEVEHNPLFVSLSTTHFDSESHDITKRHDSTIMLDPCVPESKDPPIASDTTTNPLVAMSKPLAQVQEVSITPVGLPTASTTRQNLVQKNGVTLAPGGYRGQASTIFKEERRKEAFARMNDKECNVAKTMKRDSRPIVHANPLMEFAARDLPAPIQEKEGFMGKVRSLWKKDTAQSAHGQDQEFMTNSFFMKSKTFPLQDDPQNKDMSIAKTMEPSSALVKHEEKPKDIFAVIDNDGDLITSVPIMHAFSFGDYRPSVFYFAQLECITSLFIALGVSLRNTLDSDTYGTGGQNDTGLDLVAKNNIIAAIVIVVTSSLMILALRVVKPFTQSLWWKDISKLYLYALLSIQAVLMLLLWGLQPSLRQRYRLPIEQGQEIPQDAYNQGETNGTEFPLISYYPTKMFPGLDSHSTTVLSTVSILSVILFVASLGSLCCILITFLYSTFAESKRKDLARKKQAKQREENEALSTLKNSPAQSLAQFKSKPLQKRRAVHIDDSRDTLRGKELVQAASTVANDAFRLGVDVKATFSIGQVRSTRQISRRR